jgi:hypothetical protein
MLMSNPLLLSQLIADNPTMQLVIGNAPAVQQPIISPPGGMNVQLEGAAEPEPGEQPSWTTVVGRKTEPSAPAPAPVEQWELEELPFEDVDVEEPAEPYKYKTRLCVHFTRDGWCRNGDRCCYAHGKTELRQQASRSYGYKTQLCRYYQMNRCKNGMACSYAHSRADLR